MKKALGFACLFVFVAAIFGPLIVQLGFWRTAVITLCAAALTALLAIGLWLVCDDTE